MRQIVRHIIQNYLGALALLLLPLLANAQCASSFEYTAYTGIIPSSGGMVFTNTSTGSYTYASWEADGIPFSASLDSVTYFFENNGFYNISLTLWNDDLVSCTSSQMIYVGNPDDLCNFSECVWPGDANKDGEANFYDILRIGTAFGATGPARIQNSTDWVAQPALDWTQVSADGINYKHFDCNGDGQIDVDDLPVISQINYAPLDNSNSLLEEDKPVLRLQAQIGSEAIVITKKDSIYKIFVDLYLGTANVPASQFYGLAFHVDLPSDLEPFVTNVQFDYVNDFFGNANFILQDLRRHNEQTDIAITRTSGTNVSGYGKIGVLRFDIIGDIIDGRSEPMIIMPLILQGIQGINNLGGEKLVSLSNEIAELTFLDQTVGIAPQPQQSTSLRTEPNPTADIIRIRTDMPATNCTLHNTLGQVMLTSPLSGTDTTIDVRQVPQGVYSIRVQTATGVLTQQVIIQR